MSNKFNFTKKDIDALPLPTKDRSYYYDIKAPGLELRVTKTGAKTFYWYGWVKAIQDNDRVNIGKYQDLAIDVARNKAREISGMVARGEDPNAEKRRLRAEVKFKEFFEIYMERWGRPHKKSWRDDKARYDNWIKDTPLDRKSLSQVNRGDIAEIHSKCGKDHPSGANRVLTLISSVFGKAIEWGYLENTPCYKIKRFEEVKRERYIEPHEFPGFFKAVDNMPNRVIANYILISLFTGARQANVLAMRWEQIDLKLQRWTIPMTKNGKSLIVPLIPEARVVLEQIPRESEWVFPSRISKSGHLEEPKKAWKKFLEDAGLKNFRIHDLRRTNGSWQAMTGASLLVIGKALGHQTTKATEIYARLNNDPVRESMEKAVNAMLEHSKQD